MLIFKYKMYFLVISMLFLQMSNVTTANNEMNNYDLYNDPVLGFSLKYLTSWDHERTNIDSYEDLKIKSKEVSVDGYRFFEYINVFSIKKNHKNKIMINCSPYKYIDEKSYEAHVKRIFGMSMELINEANSPFKYLVEDYYLGNVKSHAAYIRFFDEGYNKVLFEQRSYNAYWKGCDYSIIVVFDSIDSFSELSKSLESFRFHTDENNNERKEINSEY